jgi:hypothetical protein
MAWPCLFLLFVADFVGSAAAASLHMSFDGGGGSETDIAGTAAAVPRPRRSVMRKSIEDYLTQFGYLPQSDLETGALRTLRQLEDAVREVFNIAAQTDREDNPANEVLYYEL